MLERTSAHLIEHLERADHFEAVESVKEHGSDVQGRRSRYMDKAVPTIRHQGLCTGS